MTDGNHHDEGTDDETRSADERTHSADERSTRDATEPATEERSAGSDTTTDESLENGTSGFDRESAESGSVSPAGQADRESTVDATSDESPAAPADRESTAAPADRESVRSRPESDGVTIEDDGLVRWFLKTEDGTVVLARDILTSIAIVAILGGLLFGVSGVWPPLVAVESGSMEPNMERGDLIFVVADDRFVGDDPVEGTGVVTAETGEQIGHETFGQPGDVIIFKPDGSDHETPVIHRAELWVEEGENWVDSRANEEFVNGDSCTEIQSCPAAHDGFITKGDANDNYDQYTHNSGARTDVVRAEWITGKAQYRIPYLGHVRLTFDSIVGNMVVWPPSIASSGAIEPGIAGNGAIDPGVAGVYTAGATAAGVTAGLVVTRRHRY